MFIKLNIISLHFFINKSFNSIGFFFKTIFSNYIFKLKWTWSQLLIQIHLLKFSIFLFLFDQKAINYFVSFHAIKSSLLSSLFSSIFSSLFIYLIFVNKFQFCHPLLKKSNFYAHLPFCTNVLLNTLDFRKYSLNGKKLLSKKHAFLI